MYQILGKRLFDLLFASFAIILLLPVILLIAVLIRLTLGSPILFRQERPGKNIKPFILYKFRTMHDARDQEGDLQADEQRLTPFGRFLRCTSLDELPELFNVIRGEMSFVGPRPLLIEYLNYYSPEQMRRHEVTPGITGWAQVNGRNAIPWQKRFKLDVWYVDNLSFWLDMKILFMTIGAVLSAKDINQPGRATIDKFIGNE